MSTNNTIFVDPARKDASASNSQASSASSSIPSGAAKLDPRNTLNLPHQKPIVLLVGPGNAGKTAILGSMIAYTTSKLSPSIPTRHAFLWQALSSFFQETPLSYVDKANNLISRVEKNEEYIGSTNDFFVLNAMQHQRPAFIAVEAPGEHYFNMENGDFFAPLYLSDLADRDHKKVYFFLFSHDVCGGAPEKQKKYDHVVADFIQRRIKTSRDKFALVYTKVLDDPAILTGVTQSECAATAFSPGGKFQRTGEAFRNSPVKDKKIIPYSGGRFMTDATTGKEFRTPPPAEYPRALVETLVTFLQGRPWWRFWQ